jgi:3-dehydroquinate dehydratase II
MSKRTAVASARNSGFRSSFIRATANTSSSTHGARERAAGIVINPAALTHTSVAILDALNTFDGPIIEVHISNVHKREPFRHHSYVSGVASGIIVGCGVQGYALALQRIAKLIEAPKL